MPWAHYRRSYQGLCLDLTKNTNAGRIVQSKSTTGFIKSDPSLQLNQWQFGRTTLESRWQKNICLNYFKSVFQIITSKTTADFIASVKRSATESVSQSLITKYHQTIAKWQRWGDPETLDGEDLNGQSKGSINIHKTRPICDVNKPGGRGKHDLIQNKANQKIKQVKKLATEALIARMCIQVPLAVET